MPKTTQFERNKKGIFTPTEVTPRIWNLSHIVMVSRRSGSPKMILQSSNWKLSLRIRKKIQQTSDTGPQKSIWLFRWTSYCSLKPHQKWCQCEDGSQEIILMEEKNREKKGWVMPYYTRPTLKISGNRSGIMNPNLTFLVQIIVYMYEGGRGSCKKWWSYENMRFWSTM